MGKRRFQAPQVRRFLVSVVITACISGLVARAYGEQVIGLIDGLPATASGWQVIGWAVGGPPILLAAVAWNDRARYDADQRRLRAILYGAWFGLGGFLVPAIPADAFEIYGKGVAIGNQLSYGWSCAAVANLAALGFATGIGIVRRQATPGGTPRESELATRFVEIAWLVLLFAGMLFAAYGARLGFVY